MIVRRRLVLALGTGTLLLPLASLGQQAQAGMRRLGVLQSGRNPNRFEALQAGLRELGYVEGKNVIFEHRIAEGRFDRLPGLAAELVKLNVDVLVTSATPATAAAQKATSTIPIVMVSVGDPVGSGFIKSLARPGGNITGLTVISGEIVTKHLEMLLTIAPRLSRIAVLVNPSNTSAAQNMGNIRIAGEKRGIELVRLEAQTPQEIESAFSAMGRQKAGGVIVSLDPLFQTQRSQIAGLAAKHRLPSIAGLGEYAEAGVLLSYGINPADAYRRAATYVDKILKGTKPAELPVEQPTKFELVINRKTATALGLNIPQSLLITADKVIE